MSDNEHLLGWLRIFARLLLLSEGLGRWALALVVANYLVGGSMEVKVFAIFAVPAVVVGIPALVITLKPRLRPRGRRVSVFLIVNTVAAVVDVIMAVRSSNPASVYAALGAVTIGSTVLLLLVAYQPNPPIQRFGLAATLVLLAYAGTYALPPTLAPMPALHLEGVLIVPDSTQSVVPPTNGEDTRYRLRQSESSESLTLIGTVNPGTYRVGQACTWRPDQLTWSTVHVSVGATVTVPDRCPPPRVRAKSITGLREGLRAPA